MLRIIIIAIFVLWIVRILLKMSKRKARKNQLTIPAGPIEPIESYLDRTYGPTPYGIKRICDRIYNMVDVRLNGDTFQFGDTYCTQRHRNQCDIIWYCLNAMENNGECLRLGDNERYSLFFEIRSVTEIAWKNSADPRLEEELKTLYKRLTRKMDAIHPTPVFISEVMARMERTGSSGISRTMHDDLDAVDRALGISQAYGSDWKGYDAEAPDSNVETPLGSDNVGQYPLGGDDIWRY